MKIKINSIMKNVFGEPLKSQRKKIRPKGSGKPQEFEDMILKDVIVNSLLGEFEGEKLNGEQKLERYKLAMLIQGAKAEVDLNSKDMVLVKELIGKSWSPLVSGQSWEMIEPKN